MAAEPAPVPESGSSVVTVSDLRVRFTDRRRGVEALRGVSLEVRRGEILAVVGESGSGKTVLSMALLGLLPQKGVDVGGGVTVAGIDMVHGDKRDVRAARQELLGAVFQDPLSSLNPTMRLGRQLTERGIGTRRALANLKSAGISDPARRARQYPHELSGGLRQRAMIAMALGGTGSLPKAAGPQVVTGESGAPLLIVADEPTTALDVSVQAQILMLFDRLRREQGCAVVLVTHDMGVAASVADRIAVLYAGQLSEIGPTADVLGAPLHPYSDMLLRARLSIEGSKVRAGGSAQPALAPPPLTGCPFAPRCDRATTECRAGPIPLLPATGRGDWHVACLHPMTERPLAAPVATGTGRQPPQTAAGDGVAVRLQGVRKTFAGRSGVVVAVEDCSLAVPLGGSVALVGESGSGKTTTLRIAAGLTKPDAGTVSWGSGHGRPQLVFQDAGSSLTPWLTIDQHLVERLRLRGVPRPQRAGVRDELLAVVGLDRRAASSRPAQLSGGQQQRAAIARALASNPSLLICDEPVSALDASLASRVLTLLERLRSELGVALLTVTHDLAVARFVADEVYVMYRGRILEFGKIDALFDNPGQPYTQGLLRSVPSAVPGQLAPTLAGDPPSPFDRHSGCPFAPRCPLVQPICEAVRPELRLLPGGTTAACHFA